MKRAITVASLVGLVLAGSTLVAEPAANAHRKPGWRPPAQVVAPMVEVSLQTPHGGTLRSVEHHGTQFVAGDAGQRYAIRVHNNSADRVEVVVTVDGRDVVSGELGNFKTQRGYVVQPFDSVVIDGFRTSLQDVAAFRFSSVGESFAGRKGTPQHAGVIGVAVFREQGRRVARRGGGWRSAPRGGAVKDDGFVPFDTDASPAPRTSSNKTSKPKSVAPSRDRASGSSAESRSRHWHRPAPTRELGTRFGERRSSAARQVTFVRASANRPDFSAQIQYDTARGLAARGVPIEPEPVFASPPPGNGWPGARTNRFAKPPR